MLFCYVARLNSGPSGSLPQLSALATGLTGVKVESIAPGKKKARVPTLVYTPCGKGKHCRCVICNKAKEQQVRTQA